MTLLRTFILLLLAATAVHATENELHLGRFSTGDLTGWKEQTVSLFKAKTAYTLAKDNDRSVLVARSTKSASGQLYKLSLDPKEYQTLKWSWKIEHTIKKGNEKTREGDDFAARVYVIFPRGFFSSTRAICYVWANKLPKGEHVVSPFTPNIITVAADSGPVLAGRWTFHQQNIYDDYRRFFNEEPPKMGGVAIMTDTDNTGESAVGYYGDISLVRTAKSGDDKKKELKSKESTSKEPKAKEPAVKDASPKDLKLKEPAAPESVPIDLKQNGGTHPIGTVPPAPPSIPAKPATTSPPAGTN